MARAGGEFSEGGGGTPQGGFSRPSADSPSAPALHWEKPSPAGGHMGRPYKGYETAPLIRLAFGQPPSPKGEGLRATARVALAAENGLEALVRQSQARLWNRTRPNFPPDQAPVGRNETQTTTQILRAGNTPPSQRDDPRNGGSGADSPCQGEMSRSDRGGRDVWHGGGRLCRTADCTHPLAPFWFLFGRPKRNSPPGRRNIPVKRRITARRVVAPYKNTNKESREKQRVAGGHMGPPLQRKGERGPCPSAKYPAKRERTACRGRRALQKRKQRKQRKTRTGGHMGPPLQRKGERGPCPSAKYPAKRERTARRGRRALQSGSLTAPQGIGYNEFGDKNTGRLVVRPRAALPSVTLPPGSSVLHIIWIWEESEYGAE